MRFNRAKTYSVRVSIIEHVTGEEVVMDFPSVMDLGQEWSYDYDHLTSTALHFTPLPGDRGWTYRHQVSEGVNA